MMTSLNDRTLNQAETTARLRQLALLQAEQAQLKIEKATNDAEANAKLTEKIPLKKFGQPQDVAETVAFLASQRGRYITGEIIDINGGIWMD